MMNGTVDPNGLNNPRAPLPVLNGASGHYDGLDQFDQTPLYTGTLHALDTFVASPPLRPLPFPPQTDLFHPLAQGVRLGPPHIPQQDALDLPVHRLEERLGHRRAHALQGAQLPQGPRPAPLHAPVKLAGRQQQPAEEEPPSLLSESITLSLSFSPSRSVDFPFDVVLLASVTVCTKASQVCKCMQILR